MDLSSWSSVATMGGFLVIITGILITYFGKVILKSKRELTKDWVSEALNGWVFLSLILISVGIIFVIYNLVRNPIIIWSNLFLNYLGYTLIFYLNFLFSFITMVF